MRSLRAILAAESILFLLAALVHRGLLGRRFAHRQAFIAETVIGVVLLAGSLACAATPRRARSIAIGAQAFALLGTAVGLFTIAIGVGPRTAFDLALHGVMIVSLAGGLIVASRRG